MSRTLQCGRDGSLIVGWLFADSQTILSLGNAECRREDTPYGAPWYIRRKDDVHIHAPTIYITAPVSIPTPTRPSQLRLFCHPVPGKQVLPTDRTSRDIHGRTNTDEKK